MAAGAEHAVEPSLLGGLVDDAGLFPPASLPMPEALARHERDLSDKSGVLSHRFVCPAGRIGELADEIEGQVSVAVITALTKEAVMTVEEQLAASEALVLAGLEGLPVDGLSDLGSTVPVFVEVPVKGEWRPVLEELAGCGLSAKVRCGGLEAEVFPTPGELGVFITACAAAGVSFKATAGLHHALPYRDEVTGFSHHGFLNLLLASCRAVAGAGPGDVVAALGVGEGDAVVAELAAIGSEDATKARALFVSYGSCSTTEPMADLRNLGLLPAEALAS